MIETAENSTDSTQIVGRPFLRGVSGNPGGRPKGLAAYVREMTLDGKELVDFYLKVFRGDKIDGKKPGLKFRMDAGTWLSDRGFGKAVQRQEIDVTSREERPFSSFFASLSDEALDRVIGFLDSGESFERFIEWADSDDAATLSIEGEARELDFPQP